MLMLMTLLVKCCKGYLFYSVPQGYLFRFCSARLSVQIYSARLSIPQGYLLRKDFCSARRSVLIFSVRPSFLYSARRSVPSVPSVLLGYLLSLYVWGDSKLPHICIHPAHELIKYISSALSRWCHHQVPSWPGCTLSDRCLQ